MSPPEFTNLGVGHLSTFENTQSQDCSDNFANNIQGVRDHSKDFTKYLLKTHTALEPAFKAVNCLQVGTNGDQLLPKHQPMQCHTENLNLHQRAVEGKEINRGDI